MVSFYGDYDTTETVHIPFNTFSSDDPSASVTITNLVAGDVEIHKDGGTTQRASDNGVTVSIDFDTVTGNHLVAIDLSDNSDAGFYANGSRYQVRMEGTTIDGGTVSAWIGAFSIGCTLRPTTSGRTLDIQSTGEVDANVTMWLGAACAAVSVSGVPEVDITHVNGGAATGSSTIDANVVQISGDSTAADNAELAFDGTGFGFTNCTMPTVTTLTGHTAQTGDTYALANGATGFAAIDTVVDAVKVKTDYLPSATAGAANGLFICGTNAPVTITGAGVALTVTSSDNDAVQLTAGSGTSGHGLEVIGGGGSLSHAIHAYTTGAGGAGFRADGPFGILADSNASNGHGIYCSGDGTGHGIYALSGTGATGDGAVFEAASTNGNGLTLTPAGSGLGLNEAQVTAILADTNELQGDWADGGRLDLIVDAILVDTGTTIPGTITTMQGNVTDILADTNEIQGLAAGATGFAAIDTVVDAIKVVTDAIPDSGALTSLEQWSQRTYVVAAGTISGAGTGTEVFTDGVITGTVTVDSSGNRSGVVWS